MAIKLHKSRKHRSKKHNSKKTKKYHHSRKQHKSKSKSKSRSRNNKRKMQRGGFADCNLASIKEPGFNISNVGDVAGLSIPESRGAIYRPNCKQDTYQAMTP
jgi:hypothetical protein